MATKKKRAAASRSSSSSSSAAAGTVHVVVRDGNGNAVHSRQVLVGDVDKAAAAFGELQDAHEVEAGEENAGQVFNHTDR